MFCLSKGLAAPVGSMLVGPGDFINYGRRVRKALGGGMRQAGILAAAGIIAITKMVGRLKEDHIKAKRLAKSISELPAVKLEPDDVETDIVIFGFKHPEISVSDFLDRLKTKGILALTVPQGIRMVTNKEVDDCDVERAIAAFQEILS
jgi:threonine aldolase